MWLITGAGSGIGAGAASAALRVGDRVVATGRNLDKLHRALGNAANESLEFVKLDVSEEAEARAAAEETVARFGRIDVVVNSAGYSLVGHFEEMTTSELEQQLSTNFYGVVHMMRAVLPIMRNQRSGHIISISSLAGVVGFNHCAAYAASKFAVEGLSLSVAPEVQPFGIKVTLVEPGFFRTDLLDAANVRWPTQTIADYASEGNVQELWSAYNGKQQGDPEKLGDAIVKIAAMKDPPRQYFAGSDAVAAIRDSLAARLREIDEHEALSNSTDGVPPKSATNPT